MSALSRATNTAAGTGQRRVAASPSGDGKPTAGPACGSAQRGSILHVMADVITTAAIAPTRAGSEARLRIVARNAFPFLVIGALWEITAHLGLFPPRLFPSLETIAAALYRLTVSGILPHHAAQSLVRLLAGFALAAVAGVTIGIAMGRSRRAEDIILPLVSIGAPIPGVAYAPLFMLWFGLGNVSAVL